MSGVVLAWVAELGLITWRDVRNGLGPPLPSEILSTFVIFGALTVIAQAPAARTPAAVTGWGLVLATYFNFAPVLDLVQKEATTGGAHPGPLLRQYPLTDNGKVR